MSKSNVSKTVRKQKRMRRGVTIASLRQARMSPEVIREIGKRHPLLIPPFTNFRLQRAVHDYLAGGDRKQRIVAKYGEIGNWETSNVTNMYRMLNNASFEIEVSIDPITILVAQ
jgi:hypothetical protein